MIGLDPQADRAPRARKAREPESSAMPMPLPRMRFTLGRLTLGLALLTVIEYAIARLSILAASDDGGNYTTLDAILMWGRLHIPIAFVAFMLQVAYNSGVRSEPRRTTEKGDREP
jgi:hypothetical protein